MEILKRGVETNASIEFGVSWQRISYLQAQGKGPLQTINPIQRGHHPMEIPVQKEDESISYKFQQIAKCGYRFRDVHQKNLWTYSEAFEMRC